MVLRNHFKAKIATFFSFFILFYPQKLPAETFIFGLTPFMAPDKIIIQYKPIAQFLEKRIGRKVQVITEMDHNKLAKDFIAGKVHLAHFSPLRYVLAKKRYPGLKVSFSQIAAGSSYYFGYFVVRKGSDIRNISDLEGKHIIFSNPTSTSGFFAPLSILLNKGIVPWKQPNQYSFSGNHDKSIQMLVQGHGDATIVYSVVLRNLKNLGIKGKNLSLIGRTIRIPYDSYLIGKVSPLERKLVLDTFLNLHVTHKLALSKTLNLNAFISADESIYKDLTQMVNNLAKKISRIDSKLKVTAEGIENLPKPTPLERDKQ